MKDQKDINESRRDLLKGLATATVVSAVVAGTTNVAAAAEQPKVKAKDKQTGYHETQHIRDYYDSL